MRDPIPHAAPALVALATFALLLQSGCSCRHEAPMVDTNQSASTADETTPASTDLENQATPEPPADAPQPDDRSEKAEPGSPGAGLAEQSSSSPQGTNQGGSGGTSGRGLGWLTERSDRDKPRTAADALDQAIALFKEAKQDEAQKPRKAFRSALRAWQGLQPFLSDNECRELSHQLMIELKKLGERATPPGIDEELPKELAIE